MRRTPKDHHQGLIWPGYVDALSTLLMSIMFVLMIFIVAESYLDDALNQRIKDAQGLRHQLCAFTQSLSEEREENHKLNLSLGHLSQQLMEAKLDQRSLQEVMEKIKAEKDLTTSHFTQDLEGAFTTIEDLKQLLYSLYHALDPHTSLTEEKPTSDTLSPLERHKQTVASLKEKINLTLAKRVAELEKYRSEFFGRLRETLGEHPDLKIVGDRFVVQSEVLFPSGSAHLEPSGQKQLEKIAQSLKEIISKIPPSLPWILRIDGHTDSVPIRNGLFQSNWELSAARAISVVNFFIQHGIPPQRLAAAGFGEFQPLEKSLVSSQEIDPLRRNRRIELKLDQP